MSKPLRLILVATTLVAAGFVIRWITKPSGDSRQVDGEPASGGRLVATLRSEPASFNRLVSPHLAEDVFTRLTQASLVRLNRATGRLEPRLARSWDVSPDGLTWTLHLVADATFADGVPFTSADVLFTFRALYDERVKSELASSLRVGGRPLDVEAPDQATVIVRLAAPHGPGLAILDSLPILPSHKLEPALASGTFRDAWSVTTPPSEIVGLGPFVLAEYRPGEMISFVRNPRFWRHDDGGRVLPYLDALDLQIVTDQGAEMLRLESGDVDLTQDEIRAEDHGAMRRLAAEGRIRLADAGVTINPHALWFNLARPAGADRAWLGEEAFHRAVSHAVDRQAMVDTVYLGAAEPIFGPVTPGHGDWYLPDLRPTPFDPGEARRLLASVGLVDRDADGMLDDANGRPARFAILTGRGNAMRDRSVAFIQEQLRRVGLAVDVAALEVKAMVERWMAADYDAMYFYVVVDSLDPAGSLEFWTSSGGFHFWNPRQKTPATAWEAEIDDLMRKQAATIDEAGRRRLFGEAQRTLAEHLPILHFVAPRITYAMSARVTGATPSVLQPGILWNAEVLSVSPEGPRASR